VSNSLKNSTNRVINRKQQNSDEKIQLVQKIKTERKQLIEKGIPINDPLIIEINQKLRDIL